MQIAKRMAPLKGVLVMEMNTRLARMKAEGRDVINLGVGNAGEDRCDATRGKDG